MRLPLSLRARLLWCKFRIRLAVETPGDRKDLYRRLKRRMFRVMIRDGAKAAHVFMEEEANGYHSAAMARLSKWWKWFLEVVKWGLRLIGVGA